MTKVDFQNYDERETTKYNLSKYGVWGVQIPNGILIRGHPRPTPGEGRLWQLLRENENLNDLKNLKKMSAWEYLKTG